MAHSLMRLRASLLNTPHLIDRNSFNAINTYLTERNKNGLPHMDDGEDGDFPKAPDEPHYFPDTKTGILYVDGPLTNRTTGWEAYCGGTSYESLKSQMEEYVTYGVKTVAMIVSSGGGEAYGMQDSANYVRKLADDNGIKILGFSDGCSASAGYGWLCVADEIISARDSQMGSIGVLIQLINDSKALEMNGYERTFIHAGKDKVPFADDGSFTDAFKSDLQDKVDTLYEEFTNHVADHRGISQQAVKDTEANMFLAKDAIALGLADKIMTIEEFYAYLADYAQSNLEENTMGNQSKNRIFSFMSNSKGSQEEMAQLQELQAQLSAAQEQLASMADLKGAVSTLTASLAEKEANLAGMKAKLAELEGAKAQAAVDSRRAMLAEQLPADQVDMNLNALASLDDVSFSVIVGQFKATKDARAASFEEAGGEGVESEAPEKQQSEASLIDKIRAVGVASAKAMK